MTALNEVGLIAGREVRKNLRSIKGLVMVILSLLGAVAFCFVRIKIDQLASERFSPEEIRAAQELTFTEAYQDPAVGKFLADAPGALALTTFVMVWLIPLIVAIVGFDSIAGELQYRSVRYWTVRAHRASYYVGKVLGLWAVVAATTLLMQVLLWIVVMTQASGLDGHILPSAVFTWGVRFYLVTVPVAAAWCGIGTLIASQFKSPIVALFVTCASFCGIWLVNVAGKIAKIKPLTYLYPSSYDGWLLSPEVQRMSGGLAICLAIAIGTTALGSFFFTKRDV
jgi:ABC-type transport system involved in multi-copper enzyme maturation permease subunit